MTAPAKERRKSAILPVWAYVVMNVLFLATCVLIYMLSQAWAASAKPQVVSIGWLPVLLVCYIMFTVVSVFDMLLDRRSERERRRTPDTEVIDPAVSQEKNRRIE